VVATGIGASVRDFAQASFEHVGLNYKNYVELDKRYVRATEVNALIGDPSKVEKVLGWKAKTDWKAVARLMVDADIEVVKSGPN
jgi:GDPmannose 4,6-dehydratase